MKCKCGKPVAFWDQVFGSNRCFDCKFLEWLKGEIKEIRRELKMYPTGTLTNIAKSYINIALDYKIITKEDKFLIKKGEL